MTKEEYLKLIHPDIKKFFNDKFDIFNFDKDIYYIDELSYSNSPHELYPCDCKFGMKNNDYYMLVSIIIDNKIYFSNHFFEFYDYKKQKWCEHDIFLKCLKLQALL